MQLFCDCRKVQQSQLLCTGPLEDILAQFVRHQGQYGVNGPTDQHRTIKAADLLFYKEACFVNMRVA